MSLRFETFLNNFLKREKNGVNKFPFRLKVGWIASVASLYQCKGGPNTFFLKSKV